MLDFLIGRLDALVGRSRDGSARLTATRLGSAFAAQGTQASSSGFSEVCKYRLVRGGQFKPEPLWAKGIWVGKLDLTDEHLILKPGGTAKARSVQQVPESDCSDKEFITSCRGLPWNPREDPSRCHLGAPPLLGPGRIRGLYITKNMVADRGSTTGCAGCLGFPGPHVPRCRDRFAKPYGVKPDVAADGAAAPATPTTVPAPAVASRPVALTDASVQLVWAYGRWGSKQRELLPAMPR